MKDNNKRPYFNEALAKTLEYSASQAQDREYERRLLKTAHAYRAANSASQPGGKSAGPLKKKEATKWAQALVDNLNRNALNDVPTN